MKEKEYMQDICLSKPEEEIDSLLHQLTQKYKLTSIDSEIIYSQIKENKDTGRRSEKEKVQEIMTKVFSPIDRKRSLIQQHRERLLEKVSTTKALTISSAR